MRVLHVIPSVSPRRGGPSEAIVQMVRALIARGVEAEVVSTDDDGPSRLEVPLRGAHLFRGIPVRFFPRWSPPVAALREFALSWPLGPWLDAYVADYDVIHVHSLFSYPSIRAATAAGRGRVPYLVRPLGQLCTWSMHQKALKKRVFHALWGRRALARAAGVHFTSFKEADESAPWVRPGSGVVLPLGIPQPPIVSPDAVAHTRARAGVQPGEALMVFCSRLHPKKGLDLLVGGLSRLDREGWRLLVLGEGEPAYEAALDRQVAQAGLAHRVQRWGRVDGAERDLALAAADLFVLPSRSENFGIAVVEAMLAGLPVLISREVPMHEAVEREGLGWTCDLSEESVAEALRAALGGDERRRAAGEAACAHALAEFGVDAAAARLEALYAGLR